MTSDKPNKINKQHNANMNLRIQNKSMFLLGCFNNITLDSVIDHYVKQIIFQCSNHAHA